MLQNKITNVVFFIKKLLRYQLDENQLRVIIIHNIDQKSFSELDNLIYELKKNSWNFITPDEFYFLKKHNKKIQGKNILITFDDGYESQYVFAKKVLKKHKIKTIFFVINNFIFINEYEKKKFIQKKLFPNIRNIDFKKFNNIKLDQLKDLINQGHTIGAHTRSHARLSEIQDKDILTDEIISAADDLEIKIGYKVKNFAYTFGDIKSINDISIKLAASRFDFIYSGLRGENNNNSKIIARDALNFYSDLKLNHAILNGIYDIFYRNKLKKLKSWT